MIVHTHKSPGYTPRVMQTVTSNVYDKAQPLLIVYWKPNEKSQAIYMKRGEMCAWLNKHEGVNFDAHELRPFNSHLLSSILKRHSIRENEIEVYDDYR